MTRPDIHGAIVRSLTDTQRERLRGFDLTNIADAVIRELGLREEWLVDDDIEPYDTREQAAERKAELIGDYGDDPPAEGVPVRFRYVTDWKADDLLPPCKPTADARAWADLALMRLRVTAWARDCVTHGDLTPAGERALLRILGGNSE